jgi:YD repeat-containing protein
VSQSKGINFRHELEPFHATFQDPASIYDDGNVLTASNSNGTYTFTYNDDSRVYTATDPNGVTLTYDYDTNGNVTERSSNRRSTTRMHCRPATSMGTMESASQG